MDPNRISSMKIRSYTILVMTTWTIIMIGLMAINWNWIQKHTLDIARTEAYTSIRKDILYRTWNSGHGGVYVPVTEDTQPNPYLHIPERDIITPSGRMLTLMNPAYMNRQVFEAQNVSGIFAHLTSLKPINPNNKADAWEAKALLQFEKGATEISSVELLGNEEYLRLIVPFVTSESCLACHAVQGYKVGDVRGGLSVSIPIANYAELEWDAIQQISRGYGTIWLVGIVSIYLVFKDMKQKERERESIHLSLQESHKKLETSEEKFSKIFQISPALILLSGSEDGKIFDVNNKVLDVFGFTREDILGKTFTEIGIIDKQGHEELVQEIFLTGHIKAREVTFRKKDGSEIDCSYNGELIDLEGATFILSLAQDITAQKQLEDQWRESEALLTQAQHVANLGYYLLDVDSGIWHSSAILDEIFGIGKDYVRNVQGWAGVVHPDDRDEMVSYFSSEVLGKGKSFDREYRIMRVNDHILRWVHGMGELQFDTQGSIVRMIGTIQDITERKQSEELLRISEERFRTLVTSSDDIIFTLDTSEKHTAIFGKWLEKSNINPESFLGRTSIEILGEDAGRVHHEANQQVLKGKDIAYEWNSTGNDGRAIYYQTSLSPIYDHAGDVIGIVGIGHDITKLKNTEIELRAREAQLRQAQYLSKLGIWEWNSTTGRTTWSDQMLNIHGITREQFTGDWQDYSGFVHPDDLAIYQSTIHGDHEKVRQPSTETVQIMEERTDPKEFRIIRPDQSICWVQGDAVEYVGEQGNPARRLGILRDITRQKLDEQAIREREAQYRHLFEEMMDGFALHEIICDDRGQVVDYRFLAVNPAFEILTGLQGTDLIGRTVLEVMPETENVWIKRYGRVALTGEPDHFEEYSAALNTYYEVRTFSPSPNQFAVIFHDISQRKHSENITLAHMKMVKIATTQSLDTLVQTILDEAEAMTGSSIGFYHFMEPDQKTLSLQSWSTRTLNEFCHTNAKGAHYPVEQAGIWVDCVYEKKPVIHNDYASLPHRKGMPEGHAEVVRELVVPVMRADKVVAILGVGNKKTDYTYRDVDIVQQLAELAIEIVERKRAEDGQIQVQQNYENLIQTIDGIVWEADAQTFKFSFVSDQAERLLGYPVSCWLEDSSFWANHIHPEDRANAVNFCVTQTRAMRAHEMEYRMIARDGSIVWLRDMVSVMVENGQSAYLRGIMIDITEKKLAEEKLHQLSLAVEQNPASVVITDLKGSIEYVNPKFTQITGYTLEEAIGNNPRILKSGETSQAQYADLWQAITSGKVWHGEFHNRKKNGEFFWEDAMIAPLTDDAGRITHFVAVKEDITERKRSEREIVEKNADLAALFSISSHLRTAASASDMLPLVLEEMRNVFHADTNAVILFEPHNNSFILALMDGVLAPNTGVRFSVENSLSGIVLQTRKPYITSDFAGEVNRAQALKDAELLGPAVLVPLQSETEFIGSLLCSRHKGSLNGDFTSTEIQLLASIGEMVGTALRRARLYDDALLRLHRVQGLHAIDVAITTNMDLAVTLNILINQAITLMKVDAADILIFNPITYTLNYASGQGFHTQNMERTQLRLGEGLAGRAALERKAVTIVDISAETNALRSEIMVKEGFRSLFIAPMVTKGQMRGVLELYTRDFFAPNEEWMDFLEAMASQAAISIDNSQLYNDLQRSNLELSLAYDKTIEGWSHALDLKDKETEGHTLRVTEWTVKLAMLAGMSETEIVHIRRGALLHDIGKLGIPDRILGKTGKLTAKEWVMMRQHTEYAYNMIRPIEFLRPAIDIPYCHHEKWDGSGYPRGIKGEQIPFAARLFAIVDVWDAITSDRPYRKAWSFDKALDYIKSENGRQFDPEIVGLFLKIVDEIKITHRN